MEQKRTYEEKEIVQLISSIEKKIEAESRKILSKNNCPILCQPQQNEVAS